MLIKLNDRGVRVYRATPKYRARLDWKRAGQVELRGTAATIRLPMSSGMGHIPLIAFPLTSSNPPLHLPQMFRMRLSATEVYITVFAIERWPMKAWSVLDSTSRQGG